MNASLRIYPQIDEILNQQGIYDDHGTYKQTIESIIALVFDSNLPLENYLCSVVSYKAKESKKIRVSDKTINQITNSSYSQSGINKTWLVNAIILAYLEFQDYV